MNLIIDQQHKDRMRRLHDLEQEESELEARLFIIKMEMQRLADQEAQAQQRNSNPAYHMFEVMR